MASTTPDLEPPDLLTVPPPSLLPDSLLQRLDNQVGKSKPHLQGFGAGFPMVQQTLELEEEGPAEVFESVHGLRSHDHDVDAQGLGEVPDGRLGHLPVAKLDVVDVGGEDHDALVEFVGW